MRYKGDNLESLIKNKIEKKDINEFIEYIIEHNKNQRGWCDLYIFPKNFEKEVNE